MSANIIKIVENSKVLHPVATAAVNGNRYWRDFLEVIENYKNNLTEQEYISFLNKSRLDCEISLNQYLQFASEITIVDYIIRHYTNFKNEPKYNGKKNPECSFTYKDRIVNIEVKCPEFTKRITQESSGNIKLYAAERFPTKDDYDQTKNILEANIKDGYSLEPIDRMDNKLKDYLISAHKKFPPSGISNFNILVIAVDIIQDMDEWYSYLFGENGVFTNKTYVNNDYSNVDAVLISNIQHGHMTSDANLNLNCWQLENYISLLFLDPRKQDTYELGKYYADAALDLFGGLTRNFLSFQFMLDQNNEIRNNKINDYNLNDNQKRTLFHLNYIEDKITNLQIISEWVKRLKQDKK